MNSQTTIQLKPPKTFEEQLDILCERGLIVNDRNKAIKILERLNYYRFTAYALTFKHDDQFYPETTFETLYRHYEFDMKLRVLFLEIIEPIEIAFRTHIAYLIAHKYGAEGYLKPNNFNNTYRHSEFLNELNDCLEKSNKDLFVLHHKTKYGGRFPVWVALEVITFGALSKLFANLKVSDKKYIAKTYYPGVYHEEISNWLHSLTVVRNRCAHYSRLFNRVLPSRIRIPKSYRKYNIPAIGLLAVIIGIKHLSIPENWAKWLPKLEMIISEYPEVKISLIGFTEDWKLVLYQ